MKNIFEHIEYVKGKPHHFRRRVALASAGLGSALIAVIWLSSNLLTGSFAIQGSDFAMSTGGGNVIATTSETSNDTGLAGAAAALPQSQAASAPATIQIVDTTPAPAPKKQGDSTILPF